METRASIIAASWLALGLVSPLAAQDDPSLFLDTVDVYVVNLEVVVTDKDGNPVTGLERKDFEVYEDGKRVELTNFFAVEGRQAVLDSDTAESFETAPTPETKRLNLVVFIDNLNMDPRNRNPIFKNLRSFLETRLDARDMVMLVTLDDQVRIAQSFTNDKQLLLDTIAKLEKKLGASTMLLTRQRMLLRDIQRATLPPAEGSSPLDIGATRTAEAAQDHARNLAGDVVNLAESRMQQVETTVRLLQAFTDSLAGMPGRKAVLYVSDGIPQRPADSLAQAWLNKFSDWLLSQGTGRATRELSEMTVLIGSSRYDTSNRFQELVEAAAANRVAFYPLSNAGRFLAAGVSAEFASAGTATGQSALSPDVIALETQSLEGSLLQLAEGTGGIAFTRTTNITGLLDRMVHDFDTFYSLGYSPQHPADEDFHEVEVKVRRKDLKVRHLEGYREKDPLANLQDLTLSALHYGLEDNPLEVRLVPGEQEAVKDGNYHVTIMVQIPFKNLLLLPQEGFHASQVSLYVIVRDERGQVSPFRRIDLPIEVPNAKILDVLSQTAGYPLQLEMKKGRQWLAVGVRDHLSDVDATLNLELDVGGNQGLVVN